jgi:hypothetical protein
MLACPLLPAITRAGGVMSTRHGRLVAAHYGSMSGELAVCVRNVGLVARSDVNVLAATGHPTAISAATARLLGRRLSIGGAAPAAGSWWCRTSARDLLVACRPDAAARARRLLRSECWKSAGIAVADRSDDIVTIGVVGRRAAPLLSALGAYGPQGDARSAAPATSALLEGVEVLWLHQSDVHALAFVDLEAADVVWHAIEREGRSSGLSCVGLGALERYALLAPTHLSI